jgi:hypothetical protein
VPTFDMQLDVPEGKLVRYADDDVADASPARTIAGERHRANRAYRLTRTDREGTEKWVLQRPYA